jgi:nitrate/nitrite transporter NarK
MELPGMTPQRVAIAWGWITTAAGTGTFIAPLGVGALRDATGSFLPGFLLFAGLGWFLFVAGFFLPETRRRGGLPGSAPSVTSTEE